MVTTIFSKLLLPKVLLITAAVVVVGDITETADATSSSSSPSSRRRTVGERHGRRAIVGGVDADPERFPYFTRLDYDGEFGCGASLISRDFVLTAAHCAFPEDLGSVTAVVGGHDYDEGTGLVRSIRRIFPHLAYDDAYTTSNDIALLQIDPIPDDLLGENGSITLLDLTQEAVGEGTNVEVIGMGFLENDGEDAEVLHRVGLTVISDEECDILYDGDIHRKSMICASSDGEKDSCSGDSGGPLILLGETPDEDIQVGIVSFGEDCADPDYPGVYAEISYLRPWIDSVICLHSAYASEDCEVTVDADVSPIRLDGEGDVCRDFPGAFFANWWHQFQRCDWLREDGRTSLYCYRAHEAWVQCPLTCHSCDYSEDDDIVDDDDANNNYEQSSSPLTFIILFIFSGIICILLCFCGAKVCIGTRNKKDAVDCSEDPKEPSAEQPEP